MKVGEKLTNHSQKLDSRHNIRLLAYNTRLHAVLGVGVEEEGGGRGGGGWEGVGAGELEEEEGISFDAVPFPAAWCF